MSVRALLKATESAVRTALADPDGQVSGVRPSGKPPANMGQVYYAIWWPGGRGAELPEVSHLEVEQAVTVTITFRSGEFPDDRHGRKVYDVGGIADLAEAIIQRGVIHGSYDLLNAANALIAGFGVSTNGFEEPLWFEGYGPVKEQPASWVGADDSGDVFSVDVRFGRARRVQL